MNIVHSTFQSDIEFSKFEPSLEEKEAISKVQPSVLWSM